MGAIGYYRGRTEQADRALKGTKDALDRLLAYLGSSLADHVGSTIQNILANATASPEGRIREVSAASISKELRGEAFRDEIASFVNSDIEELLFYRNLSYARTQWCAWEKRMSLGNYYLLISEGSFMLYFIAERVLGRSVSPLVSLVTIGLSAVAVAFCFICLGGMHYRYDQISEYRNKVL